MSQDLMNNFLIRRTRHFTVLTVLIVRTHTHTHTHTHTYIYIYIYFHIYIYIYKCTFYIHVPLSDGAVEYADCISAET